MIYGGEKRLFTHTSIREMLEKDNLPAVFVYQTCVTALADDDIKAAYQRATEKLGKPIIPVSTPDCAGPKNLGNKLGAEALPPAGRLLEFCAAIPYQTGTRGYLFNSKTSPPPTSPAQ